MSRALNGRKEGAIRTAASTAWAEAGEGSEVQSAMRWEGSAHQARGSRRSYRDWHVLVEELTIKGCPAGNGKPVEKELRGNLSQLGFLRVYLSMWRWDYRCTTVEARRWGLRATAAVQFWSSLGRQCLGWQEVVQLYWR